MFLTMKNQYNYYIGFETLLNDRNVVKLNRHVVNRKENAKHLGNILTDNNNINNNNYYYY